MQIPRTLIIVILICSCIYSCKSQSRSFGTEYLELIKVIPLAGIKGRIDHLDVNLKDHILYMAALGNNTLEAISLTTGKVVNTVNGLDEPQGVGYIPQHHEIIVANGGNGKCYFYNAGTFEKIETVKLSSDADDVRFDSIERKIYVGYGSGGIAVIDADSHKQISDIKLPAHPEGFQLDKALNALYVNLPGASSIGVANIIENKLMQQWPNNKLSANFPMFVDTKKHSVFIGYRHPSKLVIIDGKNGKVVSSNDITGDTDDLFYDAETRRLYISGGSGTINIFQEDGGIFKQIANIITRKGARTSLLIPSLHLFVVAAPAELGHEAELLVFRTK
jgi:DNA-binding beta-propeller fold protein YncE